MPLPSVESIPEEIELEAAVAEFQVEHMHDLADPNNPKAYVGLSLEQVEKMRGQPVGVLKKKGRIVMMFHG